MTGRGDGRLVYPSPNPSVTIGLTLSTPPKFSLSSGDPLIITVHAQIIDSTRLEKPITLQTHPSPLEELSNRSFKNIRCIKPEGSSKLIEIFPRGWPQFHWDSENLRSVWEFATIPAKGEGAYEAHHTVPKEAIEAAGLEKGEVYEVKLTNKCLGTRWFAFKGSQELEGVRLRAWRDVAAEEEQFRRDPKLEKAMEEWRKEAYGEYEDGPTEMGIDPKELAMVVESNTEFEVVE